MTETITSAYTSVSTEVQAPSTVYKTSTLPASTVTSISTAPGIFSFSFRHTLKW